MLASEVERLPSEAEGGAGGRQAIDSASAAQARLRLQRTKGEMAHGGAPKE